MFIMAAQELASYNAIPPAVSYTEAREGNERAKDYACALVIGRGDLHNTATAQEMAMAQICVELVHASKLNYRKHSTNSQ